MSTTRNAPQLSALIAILNTLLEAERAGAKVLAVYLTEYKEGTTAWNTLRAVQRDESRNCNVLMHLLRHVDGEISKVTGPFLEKALKVEGKQQRLQFLNLGQQWVARKIKEALPTIVDAHVRRGLEEMYDSHLVNIETCNQLLSQRLLESAHSLGTHNYE